jgi:RecA-family ATPase
MIFGPSGAGKSFIALDMACSISAGIPWQGIKTKPGLVVYLAGEGNYGIRKRIASWAIEHQTTQLDNLFIRNRPVDLDAPGAAAHVIKLVRSITQEQISLLIVDTVNNHMSGDENAAKDVRAMVNSCSTAASALGATTVFVHHTGVSETAQGRERGSSAWRGGLDFSIYVSRTTDKAIKIEAKKVKDDKEPEPIYGTLKPVALGWHDEDGEEISGAVFSVTEDYQVKEKSKESDYSRDIKKFTSAFLAARHETRNGQPYLSRSALIDHLTKDGLSQATANTYAQPSKKGRLINNLLLAEVIAPCEQGWIVIEPVTASAMMLQARTKQD